MLGNTRLWDSGQQSGVQIVFYWRLEWRKMLSFELAGPGRLQAAKLERKDKVNTPWITSLF